MNICAVVLAAGKGQRLGSKVSKPLVRLGTKQLLAYSLGTLSACPRISSIIVVANRSNRASVERCVAGLRLTKVFRVVNGGRRRQDSVQNALGALPAQCSHVLVHDGARPFVDAACLTRLIDGVRRTGAAIPGVPVKATVKEVLPSRSGSGGTVRRTPDRSLLWEVQTPQLFRKDIITKAYRVHGSDAATDDASLVERLGLPVSVVTGSYFNIKITTPDDLCIARAILRSRKAR